MNIRKGDQVLIIKGKDRGKKGKVLRGFPKGNKVLVEGVNVKKVHKKPKKEGEKGQVVEIPSPIYIFKVKLICPKCGKPTNVVRKVVKRENAKEKSRICKKCQTEI